MTIRIGRASDAENLTALTIEVWLHTYATEGISSTISHHVLTEYTPNKFEELLRNPGSLILVAETNNHLIGYALVAFDISGPSKDLTTELATLYVQEHFLRRGVGSALLQAVHEETKKRTGSPRIWLTVNARNAGAIAFYQSRGFTPQGTAYFELGGMKHENHVLVGPND